MTTREIGIILNGATGGICSKQHIGNSLVPIIQEGGLPVGDDVVVPKLLLVGRNEGKLAAVANANGLDAWTTDLDAALADEDYPIFFDAASTHLRPGFLRKALAAGKHIYTEKPVAPSVEEGLAFLKNVRAAGIKHGAVEDKIHLPGFRKLAHLVDQGFFGRIVGFRLDFGWWVFNGIDRASQRPSWNYQKAGGGGILSDMYPHWRYVVESMLGPISEIVASTWIAQDKRVDEAGKPFDVDVEDSASVIFRMANGAVGTIQSSWATRVKRDDMFTMQIDGTKGSAVCGLRHCYSQTLEESHLITGSNIGKDEADMKVAVNYHEDWKKVPAPGPYKNSYRVGWEKFLAHVHADEPMPSDLAAGIRDVQLAEACLTSAAEDRWVSMAPFEED